jgi:MFS family permease
MSTENQDEKLIEKKEHEQLSRIARLCIFGIFIALSIVMSGDNGVLSSSKKQVRRDLQLDEKGYGFFGSFASAGRMFGSVLFMGLLQTDRRKLLTCICIFINGSAFFAYYLTFNRWILYCVRFLIGSVRIYPHIYIPVWVDQFGVKKLKTMMMTIINITSPLGQTVGYVLGTINEPDKWYLNYMIVGSLILGFGSLLLLFPSKYFSAKYNFIGYQEEGKDNFVKETSDWKLTSFFENGEMKIKKKAEGSMLAILKKPVYCLSAFVKANCLFCFQVIHLNITSYAVEDLKMPEEEKTTRFLPLYSAASVFGPFTGGMFGGLCVSFVGGYEKKKSAFFLAGFAVVTLLCSFVVIYSNTATFMCIGLFLFFFFASALLPIIGGYVVSSIPKEHKGAGSSLNLLITNIFGNLPGPIIYGYLKDTFKETNPRLPWKIIIHMFTFGFFASLGSAYFRYHELAKIEEEEAKNEQEQELKNIDETKA